MGNNSVAQHTRQSAGWSSYLAMKEGMGLLNNPPSSWRQASLIRGGLGRLHFSYFGSTLKLLAELKWEVQCVSPVPSHVSTNIDIAKGIYQEDKCDKQHQDYSLVGSWTMENRQIFIKHTQFSETIFVMQTMSTLYLHFIKILMNSFDLENLFLIIFLL